MIFKHFPYKNDLSRYEKRLKGIYADTDRRAIIECIHKIHKENEMLMDPMEAYNLYLLVKESKKIQGDLLEVGIYKGGSTRVICEAKGDRMLYAFDTFTGLPLPTNNDDIKKFPKGKFSNSILNHLNSYKNVIITRGQFPESADRMDKKFAFAHLDVDLYLETLKSLEFLYEKMARGGMILMHDYYEGCGVKKAVDEFLLKRPEPVIQLSIRQGLIVKL